MQPLDDTIAAIATAAGGAARGVVRVSGPKAAECCSRFFVAAEDDYWQSATTSQAFLGQLRLPGWTSSAPATLYYWPNARSYTRQPVVELHTLGSPPLLRRLVESLCQDGARPAGPGEFTLRAFLAGRIDLTQAEAVLGVIDAGGRESLDAALAQLAGGLSQPLAALREDLLQLLAHLEAGLDFATEEIEFISPVELLRQLQRATAIVDGLLRQTQVRLVDDEAVTVVLSGAPNVGKSSLFNALAREATAIVSPLAGTTRDYLTADITVEGVRLRLIDTAGASAAETNGGIDAAAQELRGDQRRGAQIELYCLDATRLPLAWELADGACECAHRLVLLTKGDDETLPLPAWARDLAMKPLVVSSRTGTNLAELTRSIVELALHDPSAKQGIVAGTAVRCRASLEQAAHCLTCAQDAVVASRGEELVAAELRMALEELGQVAGDVHVDDVLDRIFSRFCIGK